MELKPKKPSSSRTEQIQIVMQEHINGYHRLFGGQLMQWIDIVGGVTARRHSNCNVTTAAVENLSFKGPAYVNDTILLIGQVTYVGRTSMEVRVDAYVEHLNGEKTLVNRAYLVFVALDEQERPTPVPPLKLETEEEQSEWEAGVRRNDLRRQRRLEGY